jgi:acetyl esterase/lipase
MPMRARFTAIAAALVLSPTVVHADSTPHEASRPLTFAEAVGGERLGVARFSADGRRLAVEIDHSGGVSNGATLELVGASTVVWDLETGEKRQIGDRDTPYQPVLCESWSPSGRGLALMTLRNGDPRFAYLDAISGKIVTFQYSATTLCPWWVGDRLVYPTGAEGRPTRAGSNRDRLAYQAARWDQVWSGGPAQVTTHSGNPVFPSPVAPDGRLIMADPRTGLSTILAEGTFNSETASPDGRRLAAVRMAEADPHALSKQNGRRGELMVFAFDGDHPEVALRLAGYDVDYQGLVWSPDGSQLLVGARRLSDGELTLLVLSLDGRPVRELQLPSGVELGHGIRGAFMVMRPLGWIGGRPAFVAATKETLGAPSDLAHDYGEGRKLGFRLFAETDAGVVPLSAFTQQSVVDFAVTDTGEGLVAADGVLWGVLPGRSPRRVSPPGLTVIGLAEARPSLGLQPSFSVSSNAVAVNVRGSDGQLRKVSLDLKAPKARLAAPAQDVTALSPGGELILSAEQDGWTSRLKVTGARNRALQVLNPQWRDRPLGKVLPFDYALNGKPLRSWILLPPGYHGGKLPAVMWIYGGQVLNANPPADSRAWGAPNLVYEGQLWAARGYAVIYPSSPVPPGLDSDIMGALADEAVAAVDAAAAHGWVDPERVGIIGHSFGGFSTAAVLTRRSDRFRAGIAMSGLYDAAAAWGARFPSDSLVDEDSYSFALETKGYGEGGQLSLMRPPWEIPDRYRAVSPLYFAGDIKSPLMLTVGDLDIGATSLQQSERMYAALRRTGNPAVMIRYWGEGHTQSDPSAVADQWTRFTAWFDHYLAPK